MQTFELPPLTKVGRLHPEIAGEGVKVGDADVNWSPPPAKPCIPDWSEIKSIRHYFNRVGEPQAFPAWLYHENGDETLVKNAAEAAHYGVQYRAATDLESGRYGVKYVWDYGDESNKWRAKPWGLRKFDPRKMEHGKNYVPATVDHAASQTEILRALTLAIAKNEVGKPAAISETDWQEFQQFLSFKKAQADAIRFEPGNAVSDEGGVLGEFAAAMETPRRRGRPPNPPKIPE